jgi:hypothetical protein
LPSTADPTSQTGAILQYLVNGKCQFSDLGNPYDRLLFPGQPSLGKTEYTFVRGIPELSLHLAATLTDHPETKKVCETRLATFFELCEEAPKGTPYLFAVSVLLPSWISRYLPY